MIVEIKSLIETGFKLRKTDDRLFKHYLFRSIGVHLDDHRLLRGDTARQVNIDVSVGIIRHIRELFQQPASPINVDPHTAQIYPVGDQQLDR